MSKERAHVLTMPLNTETKQLIEGHPIGVSKIIQGDLREKTWNVGEETYTSQNTDGKLLFDSTEKCYRPWFVLVYESGKRYKD